MLRLLIATSVAAAQLAAALGEPRVFSFPHDEPSSSTAADVVDAAAHAGQSVLGLVAHAVTGASSSTSPRPPGFTLASKRAARAAPILLDSGDSPAVHIAARTFADDVERVTGVRPKLYNDTLPHGAAAAGAIVVGTVESKLVGHVRGAKYLEALEGKWESYDVRVLEQPLSGVDEALLVVGSDRRGVVYALYTMSEQIGVSPWYYWSDVPVAAHDTVEFNKRSVLAHGEPTVRYRGLFINDEHPALWAWAQKTFHRELWEPAFQADFYEKWFEMMLRLKANYHWPAMYISRFRTDGLDISEAGPPPHHMPGPNLVLADAMGIVMGTSHHEPMERNKPEWDIWGKGPWDWTNRDTLKEFWRYGAERAHGKDVLYTLGMRGDGDKPLTGASLELVQNITAAQLDILKDVYGEDKVDSVPKMWAMYKEVAQYFKDGLEIPQDVSILFSDDNFGNLMSVLPPGMDHKAGAGIYYHVDYVGFPRAYKWINTISLAKTWEQMNIARAFNTTQIWIVNVGSLKPLEMPAEHFLTLAYDFGQWGGPADAVDKFLHAWATRDFGADVADETADIMGHYSIMASRRKPEMYTAATWSLANYEEAERILAEWEALTARAKKVHDALPEATKPAFFQNVYMLCLMQTNINRMYIAVGRSNLYAYQGRTAANTNAYAALHAFYNDANITAAFDTLLDGKWEHMLDQAHINWDTHLEPGRDSMPPVSFVNPAVPVRPGIPVPERTIPHEFHTRVTVENSLGAWPGFSHFNCPSEGMCPDPTLAVMGPYGVRTRWIDVGAGGPREVGWTARADQPWLDLSHDGGKLRRDASADTRIHVSVDWAALPGGDDLPFTGVGHVAITAADGANVTVAVPVHKPAPPPADFVGFVEGDRYVVFDTARHQRQADADGYKLDEIKWYGRHRSGVSMFPVDTQNFTAGAGPSVAYDFWTHGLGAAAATTNVTVTVQVGPTLNFILGKELAFAVAVDDQDAVAIYPIPNDQLGPQHSFPGGPGLYVGAVPSDWPEIVRNDVRNVTLELDGRDFADAGKHTLTLSAMTAGVVLERVWVDLGGIRERGYSYLGPPESVYMGGEQ